MEHGAFDSYWYQGKAELTRYALRQARYGETHDGEVVLIFVTEDFLPKLQVKHEAGDAADAISVLKLNAYRRFYTGIYPYTVMTSSFSSGDRFSDAQAQQYGSGVVRPGVQPDQPSGRRTPLVDAFVFPA